MEERVSVPLTADQAEWLKRESARQERPVAFVVRKCIDAARSRPQAEQVAA
jgi:hypothetical protein